MQKNKEKALYATGAAGISAFVGAPLIALLVGAYGGVKTYQAVRDWANK